MPEQEAIRGSGTLSCVLPVALEEQGCQRWRHDPEAAAVPRLRLLLRSFVRMFEGADLDTFWIPCAPESRSRVESIVREVTADPRYRVISERELFPELVDMEARLEGWFIQQILKLAVCERVTSPFYLTLDSDIVCTRPFGLSSVVREGRALVNVERAEDYAQLYTREVADKEPRIKRQRFGWAERILGRPRPERYAEQFYGETPVVLHTASVRQLIGRLGSGHDTSWRRALGAGVPFTEYTLYFMHLELTGELEQVCELVDRRRILDLDRSIWKGTEQYRPRRDLEWWSPFSGDDRGLFVAVQSHLEVASWLPRGCSGVEEFYARVGRQLDEAVASAQPRR